jgi:uncharacterized membrane protein HdeD (DUF308 family)
MMTLTIESSPARPSGNWSRRYYFVRFAFSAVWVVSAVTIAGSAPQLTDVLLISYPAWDAIANLVDASRTGGIGRNGPQLLNVVVSVITTAAVIIALEDNMDKVIVIFAIWAGFSGILQLVTAVQPDKSSGARWPMVLSGAQSALAAFYMVKISAIVPYAAFGAFYFLVSAIWLSVSNIRKS